MVSQLLKERTAPLHRLLENSLYVQQLMDGTLSSSQYEKIIQVNRLVHQVAEPLIAQALQPYARELQMAERLKTTALQQDAEYLNLPPVDGLPAPPVFNTKAAALGAMYVLEGATLGGRVILKKLLQQSQWQPYPHHYYNIYGTHTGSRWQSFLLFLNMQVSAAEEADCLHGATTLYHYFLAVAQACDV